MDAAAGWGDELDLDIGGMAGDEDGEEREEREEGDEDEEDGGWEMEVQKPFLGGLEGFGLRRSG